MKRIQQGDQYAIPIKLYMGEGEEKILITPDTVTDVRIMLGTVMKEYSAGQLEFDDDCWLFGLTEEMSRSITSGYVEIQSAYKIQGDFIYSDTETINVGASIIRKDWDYEN